VVELAVHSSAIEYAAGNAALRGGSATGARRTPFPPQPSQPRLKRVPAHRALCGSIRSARAWHEFTAPCVAVCSPTGPQAAIQNNHSRSSWRKRAKRRTGA
jgi:hypothetical protein